MIRTTHRRLGVVLRAIALLVVLCGIGLQADAQDALLPNHALTPGAVLPVGIAIICAPGYARYARNPIPADASPQDRRQLEADLRAQRLALSKATYARYGYSYEAGTRETDHLVPYELGGANVLTNLWPQSYNALWGAHQKDHLENRMHELACDRSHPVPLAQLQSEIATDWIAAYKKYIGPTPQGEDGHYDPESFTH